MTEETHLTMKLYKVSVIGMMLGDYETGFVAAYDANEAYAKYRQFLDAHKIFYDCQRELQSVELVAEDADAPACKIVFCL